MHTEIKNENDMAITPILNSRTCRNVVLFGKNKVGKTTILRRTFGIDFPYTELTSTNPVETKKITHGHMQIALHETMSTCDLPSPCKEVVERKIAMKINSESKSRINLILFVIRHGRFCIEDKEVFERAFHHYGKNIQAVSATIITHCDNENREHTRSSFINSPETSEFAKAMGKGIFTVAFPDSGSTDQATKTDAETLESLIMSSEEFTDFSWSYRCLSYSECFLTVPFLFYEFNEYCKKHKRLRFCCCLFVLVFIVLVIILIITLTFTC